jgi:hypothetical protein
MILDKYIQSRRCVRIEIFELGIFRSYRIFALGIFRSYYGIFDLGIFRIDLYRLYRLSFELGLYELLYATTASWFWNNQRFRLRLLQQWCKAWDVTFDVVSISCWLTSLWGRFCLYCRGDGRAFTLWGLSSRTCGLPTVQSFCKQYGKKPRVILLTCLMPEPHTNNTTRRKAWSKLVNIS